VESPDRTHEVLIHSASRRRAHILRCVRQIRCGSWDRWRLWWVLRRFVVSRGGGRLSLYMPAAFGLASNEVSAGRCPLLGCGSKEARTLSPRIRSAHLGSAVYEKGIAMTMIGIDPHRATHTSRFDASFDERLASLCTPTEVRTWAVMRPVIVAVDTVRVGFADAVGPADDHFEIGYLRSVAFCR
jgi:hypothetical protein